MEGIFNRITRHSDLVLAIGLIGTLLVMVIPVPVFLIDLSLVLAIGGSLVLLLTAVYTVRTLDFAVFPSVLLMGTLFRLALNVATTRIILLHGAEMGTAAAGRVIESFGKFVVGGNYAVGFVVFTILVIINFIVITKGAGRIAEVSARFALDALPGRQMAIDSDLSAGVINDQEARQRRLELAQEADFYGSMDGASKFVRGDAIAGVLILFVNLLGGVLIGTLQNGMSFSSAAEVFTLLTVGEGLVSQIPALILSIAAGIFVTRTSRGTNLGEDLSKQILRHPQALFVGAAALIFIGLLPGMPALPFFMMAALLGTLAFYQARRLRSPDQPKSEVMKSEKAQKNLSSLLAIETLEIQVGHGLLKLVNSQGKGPLNLRIDEIRKELALELGLIIPSVKIRDNLELSANDYQVFLKGNLMGGWTLVRGHLLAIDPGSVEGRLDAITVREPAYGFESWWIPVAEKEQAVGMGYTVVDHVAIVSTHLAEVIRKNAHEILGRQELQSLMEPLRQASPNLIEDLVPSVMPLSTVLKVAKNLLREGVSIRDLKTVLETLIDFGSTSKDPSILTEYVRLALARSITNRFVGRDGKLGFLTMSREIEEVFLESLVSTDRGIELAVDPEFVRQFVAELRKKAQVFGKNGEPSILLCSPRIRPQLKQLVDRFLENMVVLSHQEILPEVLVKSLGTVRFADGT